MKLSLYYGPSTEKTKRLAHTMLTIHYFKPFNREIVNVSTLNTTLTFISHNCYGTDHQEKLKLPDLLHYNVCVVYEGNKECS